MDESQAPCRGDEAPGRDDLERRYAELQRSADEQLRFDSILTETSAQFVNMPPDDVDAGIVEAIRRLCEFLGCDRGVLWQGLDDTGDVLPTHYWLPPWHPPAPPRLSGREHFPWMIEVIRRGEVVRYETVDEIPDAATREGVRRFGAKSSLIVPIFIGGRAVGALAFATLLAERRWPPEAVDRLTRVGRLMAGVLARKRSDEALQKAMAELARLRDQLHVENVSLRAQLETEVGTTDVVGQSAPMQRVMAQVRQVAETDATVLLLGETGTGKELLATQIHQLSARRQRPMVRVNCAAIPATLIESELFGRERGAYTGALSRQLGRFEAADRSSIFLDEIGDLAPEVQVKLLRVLEERQFERLGNPHPHKVDTRIIVATHRDLDALVAAGAFRSDLYYRINVFPIHVPPLRERAEDIPALVWHFIDGFSKTFSKRIESIPKSSMTALREYSWPGNIRELRNVVERAMIVSTGGLLEVDLPHATASPLGNGETLQDVETAHIRAVLTSSGWRIRGAGGAAERLGLKASTLETRMQKLGIKRPSR